jgi:hypothetical protein
LRFLFRAGGRGSFAEGERTVAQRWLFDLLERSVGRINDRDTISDLLTPALAPPLLQIPNNKGKIRKYGA